MPFICRIDRRNTHAWQVRGPGKRGYHSRLFSDQKHGGREAAIQQFFTEYQDGWL